MIDSLISTTKLSQVPSFGDILVNLGKSCLLKSIYQLPPCTLVKLLLLMSNGQMVSNSLITDLPMFGPMNSTTKDFNV